MMHRTGKYKMINLIFGFFPFIGTLLITMISEDSGWVQSWLSIVRAGPFSIDGSHDLFRSHLGLETP
jgi:hypothetical protein